jgi:hypothetical protein
MSAPDTNGWVEWTGGECPVSRTARVEYRLRDLVEGKSIASDLDWRHEVMDDDIIAYRVVQS